MYVCKRTFVTAALERKAVDFTKEKGFFFFENVFIPICTKVF